MSTDYKLPLSLEPACVAVPGSDSIIDRWDSKKGRTFIAGETLEEVQARYPGAVVMTIDAHLADKAARQVAVPLAWKEIDEKRYMWMLECVPPAYQRGSRFLVGEPYDHCAATGASRFHGYKQVGERFYETTRPVTVREFKEVV